jgi:hypothetical protein
MSQSWSETGHCSGMHQSEDHCRELEDGAQHLQAAQRTVYSWTAVDDLSTDEPCILLGAGASCDGSLPLT